MATPPTTIALQQLRTKLLEDEQAAAQQHRTASFLVVVGPPMSKLAGVAGLAMLVRSLFVMVWQHSASSEHATAIIVGVLAVGQALYIWYNPSAVVAASDLVQTKCRQTVERIDQVQKLQQVQERLTESRKILNEHKA